MTDLLTLERDAATRAPGSDVGTIGSSPRPAHPAGLLAPGAADRAVAVLGEQLTGPGLYWLSLIRAVDPDYATTDLGENQVDVIWFGDVFRAVGYFELPAPAGPPSLAEIVRDLRERLDLPVADLAAMCGVRRRQLYNLLSGETTGTPREEVIRALHDILERLDGILDGDRERLRAAILLPAVPSGESIYSAAVAQEVAALRDVGDAVVDRLAAGDVRGLIRRPSPRLARFGSAGAARDFLAEYRDEGEDDR
jgi:transcriptional regulator with XRE-family HTH domain